MTENGASNVAASPEYPDELDHLQAFVARATTILQTDARIAAAWLIGSLARGAADAYSDVDLLIAVRDQEFANVVADWPALIARLSPTVLARQIGGADKPTITAIAPDWTRFDLTLTSSADQRPHGYDGARLLFSRGQGVPLAEFTGRADQAPQARLPFIVEEFIRVLGLLPVMVGRGEFIAGLTPVMLLRGHLIEIFLLANAAQRGGAKRLNRYLTAKQRELLTALPPLAPAREAIVEGHLACARLFLPEARRLMRQYDLPYPEDFARATLAHLHRALGLTIED